jgi:hypothetical protein
MTANSMPCVYNNSRMSVFLLFLLGSIGLFLATLFTVIEKTATNPGPTAIIGGFGTLAAAVIANGALTGLRPPAPRWPQGPPAQGMGGQPGQPLQPGYPGAQAPAPQAYGHAYGPQQYGDPQQQGKPEQPNSR